MSAQPPNLLSFTTDTSDEADQGSPNASKATSPDTLSTSTPKTSFIITERIGKGSFATVYKGKWSAPLPNESMSSNNIAKGQTVAIKVVQRSHLKKEKRLMGIFEAEIGMLKKMKHPHIVHLIDVVQTSTNFNLIMEYCSLGDLSNLIRKKNFLIKHNPTIATLFSKYPSENVGLHPQLVKHLLSQLACSLAFLRDYDIVHRDLKPQNLLLKPGAKSPQEAHALGYAGKWDLPVVKIADFGFARFLPATSMAETLCGSPLYMAPEILNYERYNAKADLWSVGAVTYEMVTGKPPFPAANHVELIKKIDKNKDQITFSCDVDEDLQSLIRGLLKRSPTERMNFEEFFQRTEWKNSIEDGDPVISGSSIITSDLQSSTKSTARILDPITTTDSEKFIGFSENLRRRGNNDVAVESPTASPESSRERVSSLKSNRELNKIDTSGNNSSQAQSSLLGKQGDSENEYVFIEKRMVEVNSLADDLQAPDLPRRRLTNPEKPQRRRRLSSITYGASPTNALAQALLKSSARLFGVRVDNSSSVAVTGASVSSGQAQFAAILGAPKPEEKQVIDELEQLATIGKVVSLYADVKHTQLETNETNDLKKFEFGVNNEGIPISEQTGINAAVTASALHYESSSHAPMDPYFQLNLANESLILHLKALSILARAMDRAAEWWEYRQSESENAIPSPGINALVQWIRDKFNDCVRLAEEERVLVKKLTIEIESTPPLQVSAERLLFDRALEMAKAAAIQEMAAFESLDTLNEILSTCEMNYGTAVWMLKSLLIYESDADALSDDDRKMVEKLMAKIAQRLVVLRRKLTSSSQSSLVSSSSRMKPDSNSSGSQKSISISPRQSFSQLTPP